MSALRKSVLAKGSKRFIRGATDYAPVAWLKYFQNEYTIQTDKGNFHLFSKGGTGSVLLCLHGGGYSALTWALFAEEIVSRIDCQVIAIDLRGHGCTTTGNDNDLSLETLASDVVDVMEHMFPDGPPPVILIGHSMGGAVAVETARILPGVVALCVIDVVEGTALESLSSMQSVLRNRPSGFKSIESAIQWSFIGQTHNLEAARVSMPGQIRNLQSSELAAREILNTVHTCPESFTVGGSSSSLISYEVPQINTIAEEPDDQINSEASSSVTSAVNAPTANLYGWRIDLSKTEHFWSGWFKGLSQKFLDVSVPKVLLLANIHGLDTSLTVGQMQGKFQLQVLQKSGHAIHEDQPHRVADIIAGFLVKQKLIVAKSGFTPAMPSC